MGIITRMLKQDAVYWPPASRDKYGRPGVGTPVAIRCRKEDINLQFTDLRGELRVSNAMFYVSRDVELGGYLWLGELADAPSDPREHQGAYEIKQFMTIPKLNMRETLRQAIV